MKQKLLSLLMLLGLLGSAGSAWGNDTSYAVYNETQSKGYSSLDAAFASGEAADNDVIYINSNLTVSTRPTFYASVTIKNNPGSDITLKCGSSALFNVDGARTITFQSSDTGSLTFDGDGKTSWYSMLADMSANHILIFKGVTIKNAKNVNGILDFKSGGSATFEDVTFNSCTTSIAYLRNTRASLTLKGTLTFTDCTNIRRKHTECLQLF